ncbi:helix-turn-helix transcriptional regulator [Streptosporangium sp. NPDC020072]|uniref:helix-turn-helix transcriptional regulator n=1 Tax=Streptosporangium sp. NPDC020072 TaxID=3154788 RepID=UPI003424BA2F
MLKDLRVRQGLTRVELADRAGRSESGVEAIETLSRAPSLSYLEDVAAGLGYKPVVRLVPLKAPREP